MTLPDYLTQHSISAAEIARRAKMSRGGISRLLSGTRSPSIAAAQRIHDATEGKVSFGDWVRKKRRTKK